MSYDFLNAGMSILSKSPKEQYTDTLQETINLQFTNASNVYTVQEETALASGEYENVQVRVSGVVNPSTGNNMEEDWKRLSFQDLSHSVDMGRMYKFDNNYWISFNVDKIKTTVQTVLVKRCNNVLRWIDENTGAYYTMPCSLDSLITENRDYATAGSAVVIPSGMLQCLTQANDKTNTIQPNQRFLFGNASHWTAYRVEGGGINNINNQETDDNLSNGLTRLTLTVDELNDDADDLINGIANGNSITYVLSLNESSISGDSTQTVQLTSTLTLNGNVVSRDITWTSSDTQVATVSSAGLVTFVSVGTCTITAKITNNETVTATCSAETLASPVDTYQVVFSPQDNYVYEGTTTTWTVYLYKNMIQQVDTFTFTLNANTVPSDNYVFTAIDGNSFSVANVERFLTDSLEVDADTGVYSDSVTISLIGAW